MHSLPSLCPERGPVPFREIVSISTVATCGRRLQAIKVKARDHIASLSSQELQAIFPSD